MRWSQAFIPTLREAPADAQSATERLLLRAAYFRHVDPGLYAHLHLGESSLARISQIVREEMRRIGGQEVALPLLTPAEDVRSGQPRATGNEFHLRDRHQRPMLLGAEHAKAMARLARGELRSYKQLPQSWYQIRLSFQYDPQAKPGFQHLREFLRVSACSFDLDSDGLNSAYDRHVEAFSRVFQRCGLKFLLAQAYSAQSDRVSSQFAAPSESGENVVAQCDCGYAAELALAEAKAPPEQDLPGDSPPEAFDTPGVKTIDDLARFTGESPARMIKTLVYVVKHKPNVLLLRGDHALSEPKLAVLLGNEDFRPATPEEALALHGANLGSLGPVGLTAARVIADRSLEGRRNLIAGANRDEVHLRHVTPGRDFSAEFRDLRVGAAGDSCLRCGNHLREVPTIVLGRAAKVGHGLSQPEHAAVLDQSGREVPLEMGTYEIELEKILMAAVEQNHDADGMVLPRAIAPFDVVLTAAQMDDPAVRAAAEKLYNDLQAQSMEVLFDDRAERPGVKFKDADLIGIPYRITLGKRKLEQELVEVFERSTKRIEDVRLESVVQCFQDKYLR